MRPKIVIVVLLAGLVVIAGIFLLKRQPAPVLTEAPVATPTPTAPVSNPVVATRPVPPAPAKVLTVPVAVPPVATNPAPVVAEVADTNAVHAAAVQATIDRLQELQANDDPQSLKAILTELANPDKQVRSAAVEAAIQFGGHDAVPVLKEAAANTTDPDEKKALQDAIEFLSLPSMSEIRAAKQQGQ